MSTVYVNETVANVRTVHHIHLTTEPITVNTRTIETHTLNAGDSVPIVLLEGSIPEWNVRIAVN